MLATPKSFTGLAATAACAIAATMGLLGCHGSAESDRLAALPIKPSRNVPGVLDEEAPDPNAKADVVRVTSPNGEVEIVISDRPAARPGTPALSYRVNYRGKPVVVDSGLGLDLAGQPLLLPTAPRRVSVGTDEADETYRVPAGKSNPIRNHYKSAAIEYVETEGGRRPIGLEVRAYDDGAALRYVIPEQPAHGLVNITRERTQFRLGKDAVSYPIILPNHENPYEGAYHEHPVEHLGLGWIIGVPLLVNIPGTAWAAITEADVDNYSCMCLRRLPESTALRTELGRSPDEPKLSVSASAPLRSPWRVVMLGPEPGRLIESNILLNLNPPSAIADTSWIRPGKTAWNWWSGTYAEGVSFQPGMNTATIKHYIDFAADSGFPYMLIDEGWALRKGSPTQLETDDITAINPALDMPELLRHAKAKGVRLWLWAHWMPVDRQMDVAFPMFEKWGIAGVKVDFMNRDDQWMVNWYRKVLAKAAEHHLMVDYHGAFKPDGIERTYPNLLTREAVSGTEYLKWSANITPEYDCMIPFTRMLAGPMDYCPGGFLNATREGFLARDQQPMVMGTRAHQLALYVVFDSYLQMVSDYPERYRGEKDFEFIRQVPVSWDETRVLDGRPGKFISMARRAGAEWYVGCISDWTPRDLEIALEFLGDGKFVAEIYADAPDADKNPTRTTIRREDVDRTTKLKLHLAPGGGAALRVVPGRP